MKTVLIVTSSYAPAMIADMHRARMLAWELPAMGWSVEILAPDPSLQEQDCVDNDSTAFFPPGTQVHYAPPLPWPLRMLVRSRTIGWRALWPLYRTGAALFARSRVDLVYFSTTQFNLFLIGLWWRARFRLPYILDIHDPIYRPAAGFFGGAPPGLWRNINRRLLRYIESRTTQRASALVSVSSRYLDGLRERCAPNAQWPQEGRHAVIPFAASERDLAEARSGLRAANPSVEIARRVVYVGAGGPVMAAAFAAFCEALRTLRGKGGLPVVPLRIELYGTMLGWREGERKHLQEIADRAGLASLVFEDPRRVTYRRSLELLLGADGALVLGVDDAGYMPSKLYTYALSQKPLLAVLRSGSVASGAMLAKPGLGHLMTFGEDSGNEDGSAAPLGRFLGEVASRANFDRGALVSGNLAPAMARRHVELFDACIAERRAD